MKKLILLAPLALIAMGLAFTAFHTAPESDALRQAKEAATISDIQRQGSDAAFRSSIINITMLLLVLLVITLIVAGLLVFLRLVAHWLEVDRWRREKERDTIYYDRNGNPPAVILDGALHQLTPGNKAYPDPPDNLVIGNSPVAKVSQRRYDFPVLINAPQATRIAQHEYSVQEVQPGQLEQPYERSFEANSDLEFPNYEQFSELLTQARQEGRAKNASITDISGVKPGASKAWKVYSEYWDSL